MYRAQNPGIKFTYEFTGFNDYWTRLTTQADSGGTLLTARLNRVRE